MKTIDLLNLGLALLPMVTTEVEAFIAWLTGVREAAAQTDEWTPEQDADFDAKILAKRSLPAYQPDPEEPPPAVA